MGRRETITGQDNNPMIHLRGPRSNGFRVNAALGEFFSAQISNFFRES
jgi:hypothetical protein